MTELCEIAYKYGTDKCPLIHHSYTPFYYELLSSKRNEIKKLVELGIGNSEHINRKGVSYGKHPKMGASLYMWRDFLPNAQIYGADCFPETLITDERIKTIMCDERSKEDLESLIKETGSDIDIFLDDALHLMKHQEFVVKTVMPLLNKDVIYIIEDIKHPYELAERFQEYDRYVIRLRETARRDNNLLILRHRK